MASACLLHYGGAVSYLLRYCGKEYTAALKDIELERILDAMQGHGDAWDQHDIEQILREGCPSNLMKYYSRENKMKMLRQRNCPLVEGNRENVETLDKEERKSHLIPVSSISCHFLAFAHHVSQTTNTNNQMTLDSAGLDPRSITLETGQ
jgi:hypothetical protein